MKALIIGLGSAGRRHAQNLYNLLGKEVEIGAYRVRKWPWEGTFPITEYDTMDSALDWGPNAVFICNPPNLHVQSILEVSKRGLPMFVEKPLAESMKDIPQLINSVNPMAIQVGYQMRCLQELQAVRAMLPGIGNICAVHAEIGTYLPNYHPDEDYRQMYEADRSRGGGVILSLSHEFDYIYYLFGLPKTVYTIGGHLSNLEIRAEDVATTLMEYNMGGRSVPVIIHQNFVQSKSYRRLQILGTNERIEVNLKDIDWDGLFVSELVHFLEYCGGKREPLVSLKESIDVLRLCVMAQESMASGRIVRV